MRIIDFFDQGVRYYRDKIAFVDPTSTYTYNEADREAHKIAAAIRGNGFQKGDRIGIYSPNANTAFLALLGLMRAEAVWLPINPRNSIESNIDLADRFGMTVMLYAEVFSEQVEEIKAAVPDIKAFVCIDGEGSIGQSLSTFCEGHADHHEVGVEEPGQLAAIFGTGGTTGKSKGVLMNHTALETFFQNYHAHFSYREDSVHLVVAPMTHTAGIMGCLHFPRGGRNVICKDTDPLSIMQAIEEHAVTHVFLPPTVLYMMLSHEKVANYDYKSLQHFMVGAAPTSLEKLKEACQVFGPCMTEAYGQTEAPAAITLKAPWDYMDVDGNINEDRLRGIGRPAIFNQVKILDTDSNEVPRGEPGEICVAGKLVTSGYLDNPEATADAYRNDWLWTGDIGVMGEDGYIEIVDRRKDMIISGGFNVYPNEVEQVITEIAAVQECAVIGVPDEKWGEAVKGVVQLKSGLELTESELIAYVKDKLGSVKAPKTIDFVDELPKSPVGKVLKTELRGQYWTQMNKAVN